MKLKLLFLWLDNTKTMSIGTTDKNLPLKILKIQSLSVA
jgi:hypothetical protein